MTLCFLFVYLFGCPWLPQEIYDDAFFEALDGVANALDNVDASKLWITIRNETSDEQLNIISSPKYKHSPGCDNYVDITGVTVVEWYHILLTAF